MFATVFRIYKVSNIKLTNFTTITQIVPGLGDSLSVYLFCFVTLRMMDGILFQVVLVPLVIQRIISHGMEESITKNKVSYFIFLIFIFFILNE